MTRILLTNMIHVLCANVIFDQSCPPSKTVYGYLEDIGIVWCGRHRDWVYVWIEGSFIRGENAAQSLSRGLA